MAEGATRVKKGGGTVRIKKGVQEEEIIRIRNSIFTV